MAACKREHWALPTTPHQGLQTCVFTDPPYMYTSNCVLTIAVSFYNDATFSDVTILMLGQRPVPSKAARKSITPMYTFHAHKIVLSAGSQVFANYFYTHPKV